MKARSGEDFYEGTGSIKRKNGGGEECSRSLGGISMPWETFLYLLV